MRRPHLRRPGIGTTSDLMAYFAKIEDCAAPGALRVTPIGARPFGRRVWRRVQSSLAGLFGRRRRTRTYFSRAEADAHQERTHTERQLFRHGPPSF